MTMDSNTALVLLAAIAAVVVLGYFYLRWRN